MTEVVSTWEAVAIGISACHASDAGAGLPWRVWVELDSGAYYLVGVFVGTEGEAIAAALAETGCTQAFALPQIGVRSGPTSQRSGGAGSAPDPAPKG
jgi:hypothetical protein